MFNEYDFNELERRITAIEKSMEQPSFCYFLEQKEGKTATKSQSFNFEFISQAKTYLKIKCTIELFQASEYTLKMILNDAFVDEWKFATKVGIAEFLLPVSKGINKVVIQCESKENISIDTCTFETFGNIAYKEDDYQLLHLIEVDKTFVLFYENGCATLKKYQNGSFTFVKDWNSIKSITICKLNQKILVAYINELGEGFAEVYDSDFSLVESVTFDSAISSVCSISGERATLFAIKGNSVYKYSFTSANSFEKEKTQFKGKKVQSNPQVGGCIIITDFNGFAKLVTI